MLKRQRKFIEENLLDALPHHESLKEAYAIIKGIKLKTSTQYFVDKLLKHRALAPTQRWKPARMTEVKLT